jgi:hypothetical protein
MKYGYEDADHQAFDTIEELESFLIRNEDDTNNSAQIIAVVDGHEIQFKVRKKATEIEWY